MKIEDQLKSWLENKYSSSLAHCFLDLEGNMLAANQRFLILLGIGTSNLKFDSLKKIWPFSNDNDSGSKVLNLIVKSIDEDLPNIINVQAQLKNYEIISQRIRFDEIDGIIVIAKLIRSGDLLEDSESRQNLFHSLSHEIRTSTLALKGYISMIENSEAQINENVLSGLKRSTDRLDKVISRLSEFKTKIQTEAIKKIA